MAWLLREGDVLASLELAETLSARGRGLIGRKSIEGALLLRRTRGIHTFGVRFPIDVAFCDKDLVVLHVTTAKPWRLCLPRMKARSVIEARAGAFEQWRLKPGDKLEIKE